MQLLSETESPPIPLPSAILERHSPGVQGVQGTHLIDAGVGDVVFLEKGTRTPSVTICPLQLSLKTPALPTQPSSCWSLAGR